MSNLDLLWHNLWPFPRVLFVAWEKRPNPLLITTSLQETVECSEVSPEPPLLQTKQSQLRLQVSIRVVLQTSHQLCCPSLDTPGPRCRSCSERPETEHSTPGAASTELSTEGQSLPCSCWQHYFLYKPGCHWPSWLPGHNAGSLFAKHQPTKLWGKG